MKMMKIFSISANDLQMGVEWLSDLLLNSNVEILLHTRENLFKNTGDAGDPLFFLSPKDSLAYLFSAPN